MPPGGAYQAEIVHALCERLRACYVFPDVGERVCARLLERLEAGEYAALAEGEYLALALTLHMQEVSGDEHLWVRWHEEPLPEQEGPLRHNEGWMALRRMEARLDNYGLHRVERLPGGVGYLDIRALHKAEWGGATAAAAMNFLAETQALILDLRNCAGGYPSMVVLIASYLFGPEPVHLDSIYWRDEDVTQQYWTLPHVPGQRCGDKPVFALTSRDTYSGGEALAYNLQARQRATVVGETTGGGAHPGAAFALDPHLEVFIPVGRAINPVTGGNWEGEGVVPDVAVPRERALEVAHRMALEAVIDGIGESASGPLRALLEEAQAALDGLEEV
jgi:hypothetical protein